LTVAVYKAQPNSVVNHIHLSLVIR
jgi:hypothetical protein